MKQKRERGAIVVEATISLTAFVFAIFTILSLVNIYFIQARVGIALSSAAKEVSQYSYLYFLFGLDEKEAELAAGAANAEDTAKKTIDGVGVLMDSLSEAKNSVASNDFEALVDSTTTGVGEVNSLVTMYADQIAKDPKQFIFGMGKLALAEGVSELKTMLAQEIAKAFMQKNLMAHQDDDADAFLRRHRVVGGMEGLDFNYTSIMSKGTNQIQLVVTYDVSVLKLLNIDFKFTFRQCAKTTAWGNGVRNQPSS